MKKTNQEIQPQEVWSAWVKYEENPTEGKYRPVIVISVEKDVAKVLSIPYHLRASSR